MKNFGVQIFRERVLYFGAQLQQVVCDLRVTVSYGSSTLYTKLGFDFSL